MRAATALVLVLLGCAARRPQDTASLLRSAQAELASGSPEESQREFEQVLARDPQELAAIRGRIEAAKKRGALEPLLRELQSPRSWSEFYALGLTRFASGDVQGATAALAEAAANRPDLADIQYRLGIALLEGGKSQQAREPLGKSVQIAPASARYRVALAVCLGRSGDRKAAIESLRPVPSMQPAPDEAAAAIQAARALNDLFHDVPQAARPDLEEALANLGRDAPGLAAPKLEAMLARMPDLGPAHALLGLTAARLDETGRAAAELQRAAELLPELSQPHLWLAGVYAAKERPELAMAEYEAALQRNPLDVDALRQLGELRLSRGASGAVEPLRSAVALQPGDDALALLLARAEIAAGQPAPAEARLEKLVQRRPDDAEAQLRLALLLFDRRQQASQAARADLTRRVETLLRKVLSLQPDNATANRLLSELRTGQDAGGAGGPGHPPG